MYKFIIEKGYRAIEVEKNIYIRSIPITVFEKNDEGAEKINEILSACEEAEMPLLELTPRGNIKTGKRSFGRGVAIRYTKTSMEIIIIDRLCARFQFRSRLPNLKKKEDGEIISGRTAFNIFKEACKMFGVDLNDYAIENGYEVKKTIEPPLIRTTEHVKPNRIYSNANHIDLNSAYMSALIENYPEFLKPVKYLYDKRKEHNEYKNCLNFSCGFFQSEMVRYKFSHLSKKMIETTKRNLLNLSAEIEKAGRTILAYNTDGVWYAGEPYHGAREGRELGEWKNDYENVYISFRSSGCYAFEDDQGKFHTRCRGTYRLDEIKDRSKWTWNDFFNLQGMYIYVYKQYPNKIFGRIEKVESETGD